MLAFRKGGHLHRSRWREETFGESPRFFPRRERKSLEMIRAMIYIRLLELDIHGENAIRSVDLPPNVTAGQLNGGIPMSKNTQFGPFILTAT